MRKRQCLLDFEYPHIAKTVDSRYSRYCAALWGGHVRWVQGLCETIPVPVKEKDLLLLITMFGSSLRSLLFAGLCLSDACNIAEDQIVFEAKGSPVLRRFNVSSHAQLKKTLDKAQVRTPCVATSDTLMISFVLEQRPRCVAGYPDSRRYLLPLQLNSSTLQVTVRGLPGPRVRAS